MILCNIHIIVTTLNLNKIQNLIKIDLKYKNYKHECKDKHLLQTLNIVHYNIFLQITTNIFMHIKLLSKHEKDNNFIDMTY